MPNANYANLLKLIDHIGADNGLNVRPEPEWPAEESAWLELMDECAAQFTEEEQETIAMGEQTEAAAILARYGDIGTRLNDFLNEVFDGKYYTNFYTLPARHDGNP